MKLDMTPEEIFNSTPQLAKLRKLLEDKWNTHPIADVVKDLMEQNPKYADDVKNAYLNEIVLDMADQLVDLKTDEDFIKLIEKYNHTFDEIYEELTRSSEYQVTFTFDDAMQFVEDFPKESFLIIKLVIRYINSYNLASIIKSLGEPLDLNLMLFISAFLDTIAVPRSKEDEERVVYIQDVVYHRSALKNLPKAIKEDLK